MLVECQKQVAKQITVHVYKFTVQIYFQSNGNGNVDVEDGVLCRAESHIQLTCATTIRVRPCEFFADGFACEFVA